MTETVLYVAASETDARNGATALEDAGPFAVEPATDLEKVESYAPGVDCVVFAETPTTAAGAHLLEVIDACGETPLVLFTEADYGPTAARSTAGIDGYVRDSGEGSITHLADEIAWVCYNEPIPLEAGDAGQSDRAKIERLHEMATRIVACREERRLLELAIETAADVLEFDASTIMIAESREDGRWLVPTVTAPGTPDGGVREMRIDEGLAGQTFQDGEPSLVDDVTDVDVARPAHPQYQSGISVPVGEVGVFQAIARRERAFDEDDLELAEILAAHVGETIERLRLEHRLRDRRTRLTRLQAGTARIVSADDEQAVYDLAVEIAEDALEFDECEFLTLEGGEVVRCRDEENQTRSPLADGVASEALELGESMLVEDVHGGTLSKTNAGGYRSIVCVPVDDSVVFRLVADRPGAFDEDDLEIAEMLVSHVTETVARLRAERAVTAERDRFSALFENVPNPAVRYDVADGEPVIRAVNDAFEDVFGYDRETVVGENIDDYVVPAGFTEEAKELNEAFVDGEPRQRVTRRKTADGVRDFIVDVVPVDAGESAEGFSIYTDVTETKRRERELTARNERLDEFASIVSHDLRNPLNVARGYCELAAETGEFDHLEEVAAAHDRMSELLERLLQLARRGEVIADTEPIAVHDIARRAWASVDTDDADLVLAEDAILEADKARLVEVFENLLRNAVEHGSPSPRSQSHEDAVEHGAEEGGLTVRVGALEDGFFFEDDGVGIPKGDRETVFESGYTTTPDGTGYGLDIVERIAEAHGWTVEVCEGEDGGARFAFTGVETDALETGSDRNGPTVDV